MILNKKSVVTNVLSSVDFYISVLKKVNFPRGCKTFSEGARACSVYIVHTTQALIFVISCYYVGVCLSVFSLCVEFIQEIPLQLIHTPNTHSHTHDANIHE